MDTKIIKRLAYDGNYQRAIELLCDELELKDKKIDELNKLIYSINGN